MNDVTQLPTHRTDSRGCCLEDCPHADHTGAPVIIAISPELKPLIAEYLAQLELELRFTPQRPEDNDGMLGYVVVVPPNSTAARALRPGPLDGKIRAGAGPRPRPRMRPVR